MLMIGGLNVNTVGDIQSPASTVAEGGVEDARQSMSSMVPGTSGSLADVPLVAFALPDVQGATVEAETTVHGQEVVGLSEVHGAGNRTLGGRGVDEPTPMPRPVPPYVTAPNSIEGIICAYPWPQGCDYWIAVAFCESGLYPGAIGYGGAYIGIFQIWAGHNYPYDWLLDPYNNTLAAWELSKEGTVTSPWPYCRFQ